MRWPWHGLRGWPFVLAFGVGLLPLLLFFSLFGITSQALGDFLFRAAFSIYLYGALPAAIVVAIVASGASWTWLRSVAWGLWAAVVIDPVVFVAYLVIWYNFWATPEDKFWFMY